MYLIRLMDLLVHAAGTIGVKISSKQRGKTQHATLTHYAFMLIDFVLH